MAGEGGAQGPVSVPLAAVSSRALSARSKAVAQPEANGAPIAEDVGSSGYLSASVSVEPLTCRRFSPAERSEPRSTRQMSAAIESATRWAEWRHDR